MTLYIHFIFPKGGASLRWLVTETQTVLMGEFVLAETLAGTVPASQATLVPGRILWSGEAGESSRVQPRERVGVFFFCQASFC